MDYRKRRHLPHADPAGAIQFVTFCLVDAFSNQTQDGVGPEDEEAWDAVHDRGDGECVLKHPDVGAEVARALCFFEEKRYRLHAWCVMPNHVHVLMTCLEGHALAAIVAGWKRFTAKRINTILGRSGPVWAADHFDRYIRDTDHYNATLRYIEQNPVKAGLVGHATEWPFSSASGR